MGGPGLGQRRQKGSGGKGRGGKGSGGKGSGGKGRGKGRGKSEARRDGPVHAR
jgi:hypothetical protein